MSEQTHERAKELIAQGCIEQVSSVDQRWLEAHLAECESCANEQRRLREKEPTKKSVWAIAAVSWVLGVSTAPWVWRGIEWLGQETGAPKLLLQAGFVLWWSVPPMIAAWAALSDKRMTQPGQTE